MKSEDIMREVQGSCSASYWLKFALSQLDNRDPVDALHDAETLLAYCKARVQESGF